MKKTGNGVGAMSLCLFGFLISILAGPASAAGVVADFNDLDTGVLRYQEGGIGFLTNWFINTGMIQVEALDLSAPANTGYALSQSGNARAVRGVSSSDYDRRQGCYIEPLSGDEIWFSFLVRNGESTDMTGIDFRDVATSGVTTNAPVILMAGQMLLVGGDGGGLVDVSSKVSLGETALVVGRLSLGRVSDAESLQVWVNPVLQVEGLFEKTTPDFSSADLEWNIDELVMLGLDSYDSGPDGTGGYIDALRLSDESTAFQFVTGLSVAADVVADFNDLDVGVLRYQAGGVGFITNWFVNTGMIYVEAVELTAPESTRYSILQTGNPRAVRGISSSDYDRRQGRSVEALRSDEIWFSFLVQNGESTDMTGIDFRDVTSSGVSTNAPVILLAGQDLLVGGDGGGTVDVSSKVALGETALVVGRLNTGSVSEPEAIQVWVNPRLYSEVELEQTLPDFASDDLEWDIAGITMLGIESYDSGPDGTGGYVDAIRLSDSSNGLEQVAGIFEPTLVSVRDYGAIPDDDEDDLEAINDAVEAAIANSPAVVMFEGGTYNLTEATQGLLSLILVSGASDVTLLGEMGANGNPATRIERNLVGLTNFMDSACQFRVVSSDKVTVKNIISDNVPAVTSAGVITAVDTNQDMVEVEVFEGLPHYDGMVCCSANSWDLSTKELLPVPALTIGVNEENFLLYPWQKVGGTERRYQIQGLGFSDRVSVGDGMSWHFDVGGGKQFYFLKSSNVRMENVQVDNTKGIAVAAQVCRNVEFRKVCVGPVSPQLAVGSRDAFHIVCNDGTLRVEDCYVKGVRWDPFNIKSKFCEVLEVVDSRTLRCSMASTATIFPLDHTEVICWSGGRSEDVMVLAESREEPEDGATKFTLTLAEDVPSSVTVGSYFTPKAWLPDSVEVRDTIIEGNCGRGILFQCENLTVTNCVFHNNTYASLSLGPINMGEGGFVRNVVIADSSFTDSTWDQNGGTKGTITLYHDCSPEFSDEPYNDTILVENNYFDGINFTNVMADVSAVWVENAQNVLVSGNTFVNCADDVVVDSPSTTNVVIIP